MIYKIRCQSKDDEIIIVAIDYNLSGILNYRSLQGVDYIICWKVDDKTIKDEKNIINVSSDREHYKVQFDNSKTIVVLELSKIVDLLRREK